MIKTINSSFFVCNAVDRTGQIDNMCNSVLYYLKCIYLLCAAYISCVFLSGSYESLQDDEKLQVFCSNPKFDLKLNSVDPEDFLDADDDEKPMYPDTNQLFSDDVEYLDMVEELNECMDDVVDEVVQYSKVHSYQIHPPPSLCTALLHRNFYICSENTLLEYGSAIGIGCVSSYAM